MSRAGAGTVEILISVLSELGLRTCWIGRETGEPCRPPRTADP